MPHAAVIIKLYLHMKLSQPFLQIQGIGEQDLILTHLDIGGRKSREIRKKRRDKGISQILSVRIVTDCLIDIFLGKVIGSILAFNSWDLPLFVRSVQGEKRMMPLGRMRPCSFNFCTRVSARFPPAESPATITSLAP